MAALIEIPAPCTSPQTLRRASVQHPHGGELLAINNEKLSDV